MAHISLETPGYKECTGCPVPGYFRESIDPAIKVATPKILQDAATTLDADPNGLSLNVISKKLICNRSYDGSSNIRPSAVVGLEAGKKVWFVRRSVAIIDFIIMPVDHNVTFPCPAVDDNFVR